MLVAAGLLGTPQAGPGKSDPPCDHLFLQDRTEVRGEILEFSAAGRFKVRVSEADRPAEVGIEELSRLRFASDEGRPAAPTGDQLRLAGGGTISGKLASYNSDTAVVEGTAGILRVKRRDIRAILLANPESMPEFREEKKDIILVESEKKPENGEKPVRECSAHYGRLKSIGEKVVVEEAVVAEGDAKERTEEREYDRKSVRHLYLHPEEPSSDFPPGLFAKVMMRNGDRWVAVIEGIGPERIRLFSHLFGSVEVEKTRIHSIAFIQQAQLTAGNLLITDQTGIHEYDAMRQEIWSYTQGAQGAAIARKLKNGNVLVADQNSGSVLEIRPAGRSGGEIVWRIDDIQYPRDVSRLENGNILITEQYGNRVAEYDRKTRQVVWQASASNPLSAQRLDNGNTLITTFNNIVEVNRETREQWRANLLKNNAIRPYWAVRLDNGNTLITDQQKGQVVEIDANSNRVWEKTGLSNPVQALRLEDGNTLILELGSNRVIEVDPANPRLHLEILDRKKGLNRPLGMTNY